MRGFRFEPADSQSSSGFDIPAEATLEERRLGQVRVQVPEAFGSKVNNNASATLPSPGADRVGDRRAIRQLRFQS